MRFNSLLGLASLLPVALTAQISREPDLPLKNWSAPMYWQPTQPKEAHDVSVMREASLNPEVSLPTAPLAFVAMTPCRVVDTRQTAGFPFPFGPGILIGGASRTFPIQSSTLCSIPATALAYSLNVTVVLPDT